MVMLRVAGWQLLLLDKDVVGRFYIKMRWRQRSVTRAIRILGVICPH